MIRYSLPNNKVILITLDDLLNLTDETIQNYMANNAGIEIDDIFSDLDGRVSSVNLPDIEIEDIPDEVKKEIEKDLESDK